MARPMRFPHPVSLRLDADQHLTLQRLVEMLRNREIEPEATESHAIRWLLDQESVRKVAQGAK